MKRKRYRTMAQKENSLTERSVNELDVKASGHAVEQFARRYLKIGNKKQITTYFKKPNKYQETKEKLLELFNQSQYLGRGTLSQFQDGAEYYVYRNHTFVIKENTIVTFI